MPEAPEPSSVSSSPLGNRTSAPRASPVWAVLIAVALKRTTRSPMPLACPDLTNSRWLPKPPAAEGFAK
ncbi:MAG: hypothetical protein DMF79_15315 [Acidobacteria bacterium]|nr:MAG: hypothetical protein DMF79_15315 [Acidobacteriota bacterium]